MYLEKLSGVEHDMGCLSTLKRVTMDFGVGPDNIFIAMQGRMHRGVRHVWKYDLT